MNIDWLPGSCAKNLISTSSDQDKRLDRELSPSLFSPFYLRDTMEDARLRTATSDGDRPKFLPLPGDAQQLASTPRNCWEDASVVLGT